jgi:transcriptional regulator with XRE-family HTH domain
MDAPPILNDILNRRDEFRNRLLQIIMRDPDTVGVFAAAIGVSSSTLRSFLNNKGKPLIKTLCLVANYVTRREMEFEAQKAAKKIIENNTEVIL